MRWSERRFTDGDTASKLVDGGSDGRIREGDARRSAHADASLVNVGGSLGGGGAGREKTSGPIRKERTRVPAY